MYSQSGYKGSTEKSTRGHLFHNITKHLPVFYLFHKILNKSECKSNVLMNSMEETLRHCNYKLGHGCQQLPLVRIIMKAISKKQNRKMWKMSDLTRK